MSSLTKSDFQSHHTLVMSFTKKWYQHERKLHGEGSQMHHNVTSPSHLWKLDNVFFCVRKIEGRSKATNLSNIVRRHLVCTAHHSWVSLELAPVHIAFDFRSSLLATSSPHLKRNVFQYQQVIWLQVVILTIILLAKARPFHINDIFFLDSALKSTKRSLIFRSEVLLDIVWNAMV